MKTGYPVWCVIGLLYDVSQIYKIKYKISAKNSILVESGVNPPTQAVADCHLRMLLSGISPKL